MDAMATRERTEDETTEASEEGWMEAPGEARNLLADCKETGCKETPVCVGPAEHPVLSKVFSHRFAIAALTVLALVGTCLLVPGYSTGASEAVGQQRLQAPTRILDSENLLLSAVDHALRFHRENEGGDELDAMGEEGRQELRQDLRKQAKTRVRQLFAQIDAADPDAGRQLKAVSLTPQQWQQTQTIMDALHDRRVQELGQYIAQHADAAGGDPKKVAEKLSIRSMEIRNLREKLVPAAVRSVPVVPGSTPHWELAMSGQGGLEGHGKLGNWDAAFKIGARRLAGNASLGRRLAPAYFLAEASQSCDAACQDAGQGCDAAALKVAASSEQTCSNAVQAQGVTVTDTQGEVTSASESLGCVLKGGTSEVIVATGTDPLCEEVPVEATVQRICACATVSRLAKILWITIGSAVAALVSILCTILSATLGPAGARAVWIVHATLSSVLCGTDLGIGFIPSLAGVSSWTPCIIMTSFAGLEAIWTFKK